MTRAPRPGPEYSREREIKVILEDMQSQFRTFGEKLDSVDQRLCRVETRLEHVETEIMAIKSILRPLTLQVSDRESRIQDHDKRLTILEHRN